MKEKFRDELHLGKANKERLEVVNEIIEEYAGQGYRLNLRQLYYQLVSRDIIPNKPSEYAKLSTLLVKGRMGGAVDWDAIEDRVRRPRIPSSWDSPSSIIESAIHSYRRDRQEGQDNYIELWVEKDALSGVLSEITSKYHIRLMVNRGYSSCTAMYDAFTRIKYQEQKNKMAWLLYLGDHDPSGLDMVRDIGDRLNEFGTHPIVTHIGLTMEQIKKFNPPPNPAKISDPRAKWYIKKHGETSWEVDALNPKTLNELVETNIRRLIDIDVFEKSLRGERKDKTKLKKLAKGD